MNISGQNGTHGAPRKTNQNIQVYVRVRPLNNRERGIRSSEIIEVLPPREIVARHTLESKLSKKFTFDRTFGPDSRQVDVYSSVVGPLIEEVLAGYNCTVFAYGQTGTGKTHTMVGTECAELKASWDDNSEIGIIPRALCHLFDELRMLKMEFSMRISYLELYNEELFDLLSTDDSTKIRIFDDSAKKGSVIVQGLEEIPVHSKDDVYKLLEKGKERRRTASTLMNAQSSRSHTVFSILVHIKENGIDGEEMLKIGKLNLVDLAGSENVSKAGNEKGVRVRETVNINQSLLTLGRVITALVERTPHIPYRESKLTRLLQESLGGRTKTSIIATISPGHKDIEETLSTLEYAHRAKHIQNKPEINQKLTKKTVLKEYTEEIDKLKRELMATRDKNGIYLPEETYNEMTLKMDSQHRELNEKVHLLKALKDELLSKEKIFNEVSLNLVEKTTELKKAEYYLKSTKGALLETKKVLNSTKRRYREKKVLLESHAKTEETLTTQATQILEVAEVATKDTEALLDTIDRRKDVDVKIQTACERFSERMHDNFEMMDDNLKTLKEKQYSYVYNMQEELANTSNVQSQLLENSSKQLKDLQELWDSYQATSSTIEECFSVSLTQINDEQKGLNHNFLADLKANELKFKEQIKDSILALESSNAQQKIAMDSMKDSIKEKLQENNRELEQHTKHLQTEMDVIKVKSLENIEELKEITKSLGEQRSLIEEEQKCMDEFQKKLSEIQEKRYACNDRIKQNVKNLGKSQQFAMKQLEGSSKLKQDFLHKNNLAVEKNCQLVDNLISEVELSTDQNVAKCSTLHVQLDNKAQESSIHIKNKMEDDQSHHSQVKETLELFSKDSKRVRLENTDLLKAKTEGMAQSIEEQLNRFGNHLVVVKALNNSADCTVNDYAKIYKEQMTTCVNDVEIFRRSELKTYTATGATPSKKEFRYPKVLVATSPHTNIVKRFRQEMDWSDLDTTVAIDEESENENETGVEISLQSISDAETLLNSTPIDDDVVVVHSTKSSLSNVTTRNSNSLRVPRNARSNSSPRNSPRKDTCLSSTNSPAYKKENKENLA